ncbi:hypothetical protein OSB04_029884 [Centaurea solstitialis]|uniref:L-gulonolactone oxidase n=1 Tax=Centaurea solstitialis TaxID=347529 RepID=A0AA38SJJ4_9ASTR|nr:hypothetical protein OSB04_029884 [Centaurea solstitialis]
MAKLSHQIITSQSIFFTILILATSTPPEDPIKCSSTNTDCTITNSYGAFPDRTTCHAAHVAYPRSENDLISIIANATKSKTKMKAATRYSHSIPKLACPGGHNGLLISTKHLDRVIEIDRSKMTITVESGVTLRQLIEEAAKSGLALPYTPYWWGLTIGGLLSTGAHGSTLWGKGSAVHEYLTQVRMVSPGRAEEGYVVVRTLDEGGVGPEMDAARVSLGVLGVISQVTLRLQPMFKRSISYVKKKDLNLAEEAVELGRKHEFADITWYPSQKQVIYRIDDRVSTNVQGNGLLDHIGFRPTPSPALLALRLAEETQELSHNNVAKCVQGALTTTTLETTAYGLTNDGILFKGYPVIGYHNRLQASGSCLDGLDDKEITVCPWDSRVKGLFYHQTAFSIGLSNVKSFIEDMQKLMNLVPKSLCGLDQYNGILMRYVTRSNAYLGKQEDAIDFDITYYRSTDPKIPRLYEDILEEIEQMAIIKYGGLPHWGKNRNVAFDGAILKYKNASKFFQVQQNFDPLGLFTNEWNDQIFGKKDSVVIVKEGCALEGLCVCSEDLHCAPKKGYFCRSGKVFKDARVCTFEVGRN